MRPAPGAEAVASSRVIPAGPDAAAYVFTQFQAPAMTDEVFEGQVRALRDELVVLKSLLAARASCPTSAASSPVAGAR